MNITKLFALRNKILEIVQLRNHLFKNNVMEEEAQTENN